MTRVLCWTMLVFAVLLISVGCTRSRDRVFDGKFESKVGDDRYRRLLQFGRAYDFTLLLRGDGTFVAITPMGFKNPTWSLGDSIWLRLPSFYIAPNPEAMTQDGELFGKWREDRGEVELEIQVRRDSENMDTKPLTRRLRIVDSKKLEDEMVELRGVSIVWLLRE
ncbi:MAG: hypothetical protein U0R49_10875 [Fimbriimonadales bacterium]